MDDPFFIAYGNGHVAVGRQYHGGQAVGSLWIRVECDEVAFEGMLGDYFEECNRWLASGVDILPRLHVKAHAHASSTPEGTCEHNPWKRLAKCRWEREKSRAEKKKEFYERMQAHKSTEGSQLRQNQPEITDFRRDTGVQCDTTTCPEILCSWIKSRSSRVCATILCGEVMNFGRQMPVYDDDMIQISMLVYLTSAKAYHVIREMLQWPSVATLYRHYSGKMSVIKDRLTNIEAIVEGLTQMQRDVKHLCESGALVNTQFTLSIDAFSFRGFIGCPISSPKDVCRAVLQPRDGCSSGPNTTIPEGCCYNNGFLMLLIPHDFRLPVKLLHLAAAESGAYNKIIDAKSHMIMQKANEMRIRIWFRATDGDPGVANSHNKFYEEHIYGHTSNYGRLIEDVWKWLCAKIDSFVPISDPLHVWKNIRSRFITRRIILFKDSPATDINEVRKKLCLGNVLDDTSQIGKMRDNYVTALFTFNNVSTLIKDKQYTSAFLLLPFVCWRVATFSDQIDRELRIFLCELAFQLLVLYLEAFDEISSDQLTRDGNGQMEQDLFSRPHYVRRMINTLCAFGVALVFGSDALRMDSLGTHLVENAIGIARSTSSDHRYERILTTYTHNELRKELAANLEIPLHVQGRINDGGCKVDLDDVMSESVGTLTSKPSGWNVPYILHLARSLCCQEVASVLESDAMDFAGDLDSLSHLSDGRMKNTSMAANCGILSRLYSFKSEPHT